MSAEIAHEDPDRWPPDKPGPQTPGELEWLARERRAVEEARAVWCPACGASVGSLCGARDEEHPWGRVCEQREERAEKKRRRRQSERERERRTQRAANAEATRRRERERVQAMARVHASARRARLGPPEEARA